MDNSDETKIAKSVELDSIKNTLFLGKVLYFFEAIDSTNTAATEFLSQKNNEKMGQNMRSQSAQNTEGVVFLTFNQTAGRGQMGNQWACAPDENIAISLIFTPSFLHAQQQFYLNKAIALGIYDFFEAILPPASQLKIKWPNDIFLNDRKIGGVLIQNALSGAFIQSAIVGIGLNINQRTFDNLPQATSLFLETNQLFDLKELAGKLCQALEKRYLQLKARHFDSLSAEYLTKLYRYGEEALFQRADGRLFSGEITGVSEAGLLSIKLKGSGVGTEKGIIEEFDLKAVRFVFA